MTGVGFAAIGLAFRGDAPRSEVFLAVFLAIGLVFLTLDAYLRVDALARVFLHFALILLVVFFRFAITASLTRWTFETCTEMWIPFASIDPTLDHLLPNLRTAVEMASERRRLFCEVLHAANDTMQESRALVARSRGKLYLASWLGRSTIRD